MDASKQFGIIGAPVAGSLSPRLFAAAYGGRYGYHLIEGDDFEASWERFLADYQGINVTAPFKERAFAKADVVTRVARKIKAVNLVVKTPAGIEAHNTDFTGIVLSVLGAVAPGAVQALVTGGMDSWQERLIPSVRACLEDIYPTRPEALIVGCGGAGRAAAVAAAEMGFRVTLMNRTLVKAAGIAAEMPEYGFSVKEMSALKEMISRCDLIIYTPPAALPYLENLSIEDFAGDDPYGRPAKVILEANYKTPAFDGLLKDRLGAGGAQYVPGQLWLLYQAVAGYGIFTGEEPDFAAMVQALKQQR